MQLISDKLLAQYRHCIPVNSLVKDAFEKLATETEFRKYQKNEQIFAIGDNDEDSLFLLEGEIALFSKDGKRSIISTEHKQSLYAIASLKPRLFSAQAKKDSLLAAVKTKVLDNLLIWEQSASNSMQQDDISVSEIDDEDTEWKMSMLQTQTFLTLPSANILSLFDAMEKYPVSKDQVIIRQGDVGDYYYIIKEGSCQVSRTFQDDVEPVILNKLGPMDCFGEEALVSGERRNATVKMLTDGVLMRLAKDKFHTLVEEPLLQKIDYKQARELVKNGAVAVDVRNEDEYAHSGIKNTLNIPLYLLRLQLPGMDKNRTYILFCDTGSRSSAAAFLMKQAGFNSVYVLKNGLYQKTNH